MCEKWKIIENIAVFLDSSFVISRFQDLKYWSGSFAKHGVILQGVRNEICPCIFVTISVKKDVFSHPMEQVSKHMYPCNNAFCSAWL